MRFVVAFLLLVLALAPARAENLWDTLPVPAAMPKADKSGLASVNGIQMYYAVYGQGTPGGTPVLLLHGGLGNADYWGDQVPALTAAGYQVIVADSRGHGRSTRNADPFGYHLMAEDVIALLDVLKVDKVALIGWSDGGIIGLDIAMNHPERLSKLFAYGANYDPSGPAGRHRRQQGLQRLHRAGGGGLCEALAHAHRVRRLPRADRADVGDAAELHARPAEGHHGQDDDLGWRP